MPPFDTLPPTHFSSATLRSGPVYSQSFMASDPATGGASLATCLEVGAVSQDSDTGAHLLPGFAVGYDDGRVDFLAFGDNYVTQVGWLVGWFMWEVACANVQCARRSVDRQLAITCQYQSSCCKNMFCFLPHLSPHRLHQRHRFWWTLWGQLPR